MFEVQTYQRETGDLRVELLDDDPRPAMATAGWVPIRHHGRSGRYFTRQRSAGRRARHEDRTVDEVPDGSVLVQGFSGPIVRRPAEP